MSVSQDPRLPAVVEPTKPSLEVFKFQLTLVLREFAALINLLAGGKIAALTNKGTSAPTTGTWEQGDFYANTGVTELGGSGIKYSIEGWRCVASGTPGTWVECRELTGGGLDVTKLLTATATLDFPSVGSNSMASLTATVTGAAAGDFVIVSPPAAFESGFTFCAFVSATDTVKVRIHNNNGGAVDPASGTWGITVMNFG